MKTWHAILLILLVFYFITDTKYDMVLWDIVAFMYIWTSDNKDVKELRRRYKYLIVFMFVFTIYYLVVWYWNM